MKNPLLLLLLLIVVFSGKLQAQNEAPGSLWNKFYVGGKAGYGMANFESTTSEKNFAKPTFDNISYGILLGFKVSGQLSVQIEGNYAQYGANEIMPNYIYSADNPLFTPINSNTTIDHINMDLYYADFPLTLRYFITDGDFTPYVYAGVNWGINVSGNTTIVNAIKDIQKTLYREFKDDITNKIQYNEIAPVFGGGIKFNIGSLSVFGDLRYKYGVMNQSNVINDLGFKSSALWLSAGVYLNL